MATQRLLGRSRAGEARPGESLVQIISFLGARRRELKASAGERLLLLEARVDFDVAKLGQLEPRLASVEAQLERARAAASARTGLRRARIVQLRQQLQILRTRGGVRDSTVEARRAPERHSARAPRVHPGGSASAASMHRLGSVLMYVGGLLVLWVMLLELGLALGLT